MHPRAQQHSRKEGGGLPSARWLANAHDSAVTGALPPSHAGKSTKNSAPGPSGCGGSGPAVLVPPPPPPPPGVIVISGRKARSRACTTVSHCCGEANGLLSTLTAIFVPGRRGRCASGEGRSRQIQAAAAHSRARSVSCPQHSIHSTAASADATPRKTSFLCLRCVAYLHNRRYSVRKCASAALAVDACSAAGTRCRVRSTPPAQKTRQLYFSVHT
jgi:hypothetical protein